MTLVVYARFPEQNVCINIKLFPGVLEAMQQFISGQQTLAPRMGAAYLQNVSIKFDPLFDAVLPELLNIVVYFRCLIFG